MLNSHAAQFGTKRSLCRLREVVNAHVLGATMFFY